MARASLGSVTSFIRSNGNVMAAMDLFVVDGHDALDKPAVDDDGQLARDIAGHAVGDRARDRDADAAAASRERGGLVPAAVSTPMSRALRGSCGHHRRANRPAVHLRRGGRASASTVPRSSRTSIAAVP